ncbi:hypothetical protein A4A49_38227 [Nicotiana attenuata]|uniref:RNase H type-1 domain-containing protein n=1 Tax=Nicotiana attenuata TaxID=49451 RepID=A0A1J6KFJ5_NICAT|nr:hypothetical protein A4A49_38227 [Nicotiana attenuata]
MQDKRNEEKATDSLQILVTKGAVGGDKTTLPGINKWNQGKPAVHFSAEDYFVNLAQECRLTLIGKFYRTKPPMEDIRKAFVSQFHLKGTVKIAYYDPQHVYIDFANEVDYTHIKLKKFVDINGTPMKILLWTPDFKQEVETPIVQRTTYDPTEGSYTRSTRKGIDTGEPKAAHTDAAGQQGANQDDKTKKKKKRNRAKKQEHIKEREEARAQIQHGKQQEESKIKDNAMQMTENNSKRKDDQCQHLQHEEGLQSNPEVTREVKVQKKESRKTSYPIEPGEIQKKFEKLIFGTNLEGRSSHDNEPVSNESSNESSESSDEENENSEDNDYEDEEGSDESEEYASVDSEEEDGDDNANRLVEVFVGNATISHAVNNVINSGALRPIVLLKGLNSCQIWLFWEEDLDCIVVDEDEQQVTCVVKHDRISLLITSVHAKCEDERREDLWDKLRSIGVNFNLPWFIAGDFNCITDPIEKKGGSPHRMSKSLSFIQCIMVCELVDAGYSGSSFTWCNGWCPNRRLWQRLHRVLVNHEWLNLFDCTSVNHLVRTRSDHSPLLALTKSTIHNPIKYFKFLNFWAEEDGFMNVVEQAWNEEVHGSPLWRFHLKLKNTCRKLSEWSKISVGNIFDITKALENRVAELGEKSITDNSASNRADLNKANAELMPHTWNDLCCAVENAQQVLSCQVVRWTKPGANCSKLNYGCSKGNPGSSGGGGVIRDEIGDVQCAFADFYGHCSNIMAEAKAMLQGIIICKDRITGHIIVESDSLVLVNIINYRLKPPWEIGLIIDLIIGLVQDGNITFVHILREGNTVADSLANLVESLRNQVIFNNIASLPGYIKALVAMDKEGIPNLRFKTKKNQFVINDVPHG